MNLKKFIMCSLFLAAAACTTNGGAPCKSPSDCPQGQQCNQNTKKCEATTAQVDKCADKHCDLGKCNPADGKCSLNPDTCDGTTRCLKDNICYEHKCYTETQLCVHLNCKKGETCNTVGTPSCEENQTCNDDDDCIDGSFCTQTNLCHKDLCLNKTCDRGICDRMTGGCIDAVECHSHKECSENKFCVEKKCVDETAACERCSHSSHLTCNKDAYPVTCTQEDVSSYTCKNALDCLKTQFCDVGNTPAQCQSDTLLPSCTKSNDNKTIAGAEILNSTAPNVISSAKGKLCTEDYQYRGYKVEGFSGNAELSVSLSLVDPSQVGLMPLTLEIFDSNGNLVGDKEELPYSEHSILIKRTVADGTYYVKVSSNDYRNAGSVNYMLIMEASESPASAQCNNPTNIDLQNGQETTVSFNIRNSQIKLTNGLTSSCARKSNETPEKVYAFNLDHDAYISLKATTHPYPLSFSIRPNCYLSAEETCINTEQTNRIDSFFKKGSYYLIVQATDPKNVNALDEIEFKIFTQSVICEKSKALRCDGNHLIECNNLGTKEITRDCGTPSSSATSSCKAPTATINEYHCENSITIGTSCENPFLLNENNQFKGSENNDGFISTNNEHYLRNLNAEEFACSGKSPRLAVRSDGFEKVTRVDAHYGDRIIVDNENTGSSTHVPVIYILKGGCNTDTQAADHGKCVAYIDRDGKNVSVKSSHLEYDVKEPGVYYVIADEYFDRGGEHDTWKIKVKVEHPTCVAGERQCSIDGSSVQKCIQPLDSQQNPQPEKWVLDHNCDNGCNEGQCQSITNYSCNDPKDISTIAYANGTVTGYLSDYKRQPTEITIINKTSCTLGEATGADAVYKIVPHAAGDVFNIQLTSSDLLSTEPPPSFLVTASTDCADPENTCIKGVSKFFEDTLDRNVPISFKLTATNTDPIYIRVKGQYLESSGQFNLSFDTKGKICTPGTSTCDGTTKIKICNEDGTKEDIKACNCTGSNENATCTDSDATTCATAEVLAENNTTAGKLENGNKRLNPGLGVDNKCTFNTLNLPKGPDKFYRVEVPAKNVLDLDYTLGSPSNMVVYLMKACKINDNQCLNTSTRRSTTNGNIKWFNDSNSSVSIYVIVSTTKETLDATDKTVFSLTPHFYQSECDNHSPGESIGCETDAQGKHGVTVCDDSYHKVFKECPFSCDDTKNTCSPPTNNTCTTAHTLLNITSSTKVGETVSLTGNLSEWHKNISYDYNSSNNCNQNTSMLNDPSGPDAIFKVTGEPNTKVKVTMEMNNPSPIVTTILYQIDGCGTSNGTNDENEETYNVTGECVKGYASNIANEIETSIPTSGEVYFVVDSFGENIAPNSNFTIRVKNLGPPTCIKDTVSCSVESGTAIEKTCDHTGDNFIQEQTRVCFNGCDPSNTKCAELANNTCSDVKDGGIKKAYVTDSTTIYDDLLRFDNNYNPTDSSCNNGTDTYGHDAIYLIDRSTNKSMDNEKVTVSFESIPSIDTSLGLTDLILYVYPYNDDCSTLTNSTACLSSTSASSTSGKIEFNLPDTDKAYLVVKSKYDRTTPTPFKLDISFGNFICTEGNTRCLASANNVEEKCINNKWVERGCVNRCIGDQTNGHCDKISNNTCDGAEEIDISNFTSTQNKVISDALNTATDNYTIDANSSCNYYAGKILIMDPYFKLDRTYLIKGKPNQIVRAKVVGRYSTLYAATSCDNINGTCLTNEHWDLDKEAKTILFRLPDSGSAESQSYLFVDGDLEYTLTVDSPQPQFAPNKKWCDGRYIYQSDELGIYKKLLETCYNGCDTSSANPTCFAPINNTCDQAQEINLSNSTNTEIVSGKLTSSIYTDTKSADKTFCNSIPSGVTYDAQDAFYKVTASEGHLVTIKSVGTNVSLYSLNECSAATCMHSSNTQILREIVPTGGVFYFAVDGESSSLPTESEFSLIVTQSENNASCNPIGVYCDSSKQNLIECSGDTPQKTIPCNNGCDDSSGVAICKSDAIPNACSSAKELHDGNHISGDLIADGYTDTLSPTCPLIPSGTKKYTTFHDAVYKFTLKANHYFTATFNSPHSEYFGNMLLWITPDCEDQSACTKSVKLSPQAASVAEAITIDLTNDTNVDKTYYLYIDTTFDITTAIPKTTLPFTLDVSIIERCNKPGEKICDGQLFKECDSFGNKLTVKYCNDICDINYLNHCKSTTNVQCKNGDGSSAAKEIVFDSAGDATIEGLFRGFENNNPVIPDTYSSCGRTDYKGLAGYYSVQLNKGDILTYGIEMPHLDKYNNSLAHSDASKFDYPRVFITEDCQRYISCDSFIEGNNSKNEFTAPESGTYYIVAQDHSEERLFYPYGLFRLTLHKGTTPTLTCSDTPTCDGTGIKLCDQRIHNDVNFTCLDSGTCQSNSTPNKPPVTCSSTHSGLICADAIPISNGEYISGMTNGQGSINSFSPSPFYLYEHCNVDIYSKPYNRAPTGNEMYYTISVAANQRIRIAFETTTPNSEVYILRNGCDKSNCAKAQTTKSATKNNKGILEYESGPNTEQLFIVFDSTVPGEPYDFNFTTTFETVTLP